MTFIACDCPLTGPISDLTISDCEDNISQIQRIIFQRQGYIFDGTAGKDITLLADWQTVIAAIDDTKAQASPFVYNPIITAGEKVTNGGGDNTTLNGDVELVGANPSSFTAIFKGLNKDQITELSKYICENKLGVYFVNDAGKIIANEETSGNFSSFPVSAFFVGDKTNNGLNTKDENMIEFSLKKGWSCTATSTSPADFDPLTDI